MYTTSLERLKKWFLTERRDLPWRNQASPYAVWVSEVMLQQTQVSVVIPYFERWMKRFPTIRSLAEADLNEVIKLWEGLGYYSRARSLHEGSRYVMEYYGGELPAAEAELKKIKGLGPYTVAAILSFAFKQKAAPVDGNVIRVLTRFLQIEDDVSKNVTLNHLRKIAFGLLPNEESWIHNEALIELGATVCKKKPQCHHCPLRTDCKSYIEGDAERLPYKSLKIKTEYLYRIVPVIMSENQLLVKRGEKGKIMSDLHEFPFFETTEEGWTVKQLMKKLSEQWSLQPEFVQQLDPIQHSFTKYQVRLFPILFKCQHRPFIEGHLWLSKEELKQLAFSSGHRRIFSIL